MRRPALIVLILLACVIAVATAQTAAPKPVRGKAGVRTARVPDVSNIDVRVQKTQDDFFRETAELARQYEDAGHLDKTRELYETILKIKPDLPAVKQKMEQLDEQLLSSNEFSVSVDPAGAWSSPAALVFSGKPIRFQAEGQYRVTSQLELGPDGIPADDAGRGLTAGIPVGALMGTVLKDGKPEKPFLIGKQLEWTPKESGVLLLRVNALPGSKATGKLTVLISGYAKGQ